MDDPQTLYMDDYHFFDTKYLLTFNTFDGNAAFPHPAINCHFVVGGVSSFSTYTYPDLATRDAAVQAIRARLQARILFSERHAHE